MSTLSSDVKTTPLADIFTDCVVHLWGCSEDEQRRLTRYIVAYPLSHTVVLCVCIVIATYVVDSDS